MEINLNDLLHNIVDNFEDIIKLQPNFNISKFDAITYLKHTIYEEVLKLTEIKVDVEDKYTWIYQEEQETKEEVKIREQRKPVENTTDTISFDDEITDKQKYAINKITQNLGIIFEGTTKNEARLFICKYINQSKTGVRKIDEENFTPPKGVL